MGLQVGDRVVIEASGRNLARPGVIIEYDQMHPVKDHEVRVRLAASETVVRVRVDQVKKA